MKRQTTLTKALIWGFFAMTLTIGGVLSSCSNNEAGAHKDSDSVENKESYDKAEATPSDISDDLEQELSELKEEVIKNKTDKDLSDLKSEVKKKEAEDNLVN